MPSLIVTKNPYPHQLYSSADFIWVQYQDISEFGAMAKSVRRVTTNHEIPGSSPGSLVYFLIFFFDLESVWGSGGLGPKFDLGMVWCKTSIYIYVYFVQFLFLW